MLKEKVSLLHKHDEHLLGEKLRNHIADTIKFVTQTKQIFTGYKKLPFTETLKRTKTK